jgi:uracil-DNA glycosylase
MNPLCSKECTDVDYVCHIQKTSKYDDIIRMILISESMPAEKKNYFDAKGYPQFILTTNFIFNKLGFNYHCYEDYLQNGIYLTTSLKCIKKEYLVKSKTIENCSNLLEKELNRFKNLKIIMLMGDYAIKAVNYIWKRNYNVKVIPAGPTYKIRTGSYKHNGIRFFPSYTQTGDSFGLEKSKLAMIHEDIRKAMEFMK